MLRFKPLTAEDFEQRYSHGVISDPYIKDNNHAERSLYSNKIFGTNGMQVMHDGSTTLERAYRRGTIEFPVPLLNYVITGSATDKGGNLMLKVLGLDSSDFVRLMTFTSVYSKEQDKIIRYNDEANKAFDKYLVHADALLHFIDKFDREVEIKRELAKKFDEHIDGISPEAFTFGTGEVHVFAGWYINYPMTEKLANRIDYFIKNELIKSGNERLVYLVNLESKEVLRNLIIRRMIVTPPDSRPASGDNRHDPITLKYSDLIKRATQLADQINTGELKLSHYVQYYKSLDKVFTELTYASSRDSKNQKSFKEANTSKKGRVRYYLLGKRVDHSGRSAIIVNPSLRLDQIGIPIDMLGKLYRYHLMKRTSPQQMDKLLKRSSEDLYRELKESGILDSIPVAVNRAPTLHRLSFRSFYVVPSYSKAIELHPLVCPGYNADFDGDQMAVHVPLLEESIKEVIELMLSTRNLFVPASGEHTLLPRQEIIYGLNVASRDYDRKPLASKIFNSLDELKESVLSQITNVADTVQVKDYGSDTAGKHLLRWCLPKSMRGVIEVVTKKSIVKYADKLLETGLKNYSDAINRMVEVGFAIAELYAPATSIIDEINPNSLLADPFGQFHKNMETVSHNYALGLEDEETYTQKFEDEFKKVEELMSERIASELGAENGYLQLVESGARGSKENLIQIYGYKGRIQKNSYESFRAVIEKSFSDQLGPLEHFISAYGTRKGMIDKVQKTGDTGYANRKMYQAASDILIRSNDCGTEAGLPLRKSDIRRHVKAEEESKKQEITSTIYQDVIRGRYIAKKDRIFNPDYIKKEQELVDNLLYELGPTDERYRNRQNQLANMQALANKLRNTDYYIDAESAKLADKCTSSITLRSPLTCLDQTCSKCYGDDLTIRGKAVKGTPVGFIAGQSIGEPGTQLTMRTFHKGGVAGKADVTSDFDRMEGFLSVFDLAKKPTYDPIAWATGKVSIKESYNKVTIRIERPSDEEFEAMSEQEKLEVEKCAHLYKKHTEVPVGADIKPYAVKGEGLCVIEGDHTIKEVLEFAGEMSAKVYLTLAMYMTYHGKAEVNFKHFEVLVSEMFRYIVKHSENPEFKPGLLYSRRELMKHQGVRYNEDTRDYEAVGVTYTPIVLSATDAQIRKNDPLNTVLMEKFVLGLGRSVLLGLESNHDSQMGRLMLSQRLTVGTGYNDNYIADRRKEENYVD